MNLQTNYELTRVQFLPNSINDVFKFFSKPENLKKITPTKLNFSILNTIPIEMKKGQIIDYEIKIKGIPINWSSIISSYDPPNSFIDEQITGPFSVWIHKHDFQEVKGGTKIIDKILYKIPFGLIGTFANYIFVKRDLKEIFDYREQTIIDIFNNKNHKYNI